jgi:hypothetical protein
MKTIRTGLAGAAGSAQTAEAAMSTATTARTLPFHIHFMVFLILNAGIPMYRR